MEISSLQAFLYLFFFILFSVFFFCFIQNPSKRPRNRAYPLIGHLPQFLKNRHRLLDWTTELLAASPTNTFSFRRLGNVRGVFTANPSNIEYVLKTHFENFPKGPIFISLLKDFLGHGIFNSDGELWKVQRKTSSFEFNTRSLRNFVVDSVRREILSRLVPFLGRAARSGDTVDLQDVLERFAFDNVCKVAFNEDPACLAAEEGEEEGRRLSPDFALAFKDAANLSAGRFRYAIPPLWVIKRLLGVGSERRLRESTETVHDFATKIIRSRKKEMENNSSGSSLSPVHDDLLSRFLANAAHNSEEFLRDIVISFLLAGRETTSSSLAWFFWLLSSRPDVELRILEEIKWVRGRNQASSDEAFSFEDLREMHYLHAAISEALRLYPPVAINSAQCQADDVLPDGTPVKKGWFLSYNSYAMGRMEDVWGEDCLEYKPERWLEDGTFKPESPFKFLAFHAGPRMCLGKEMAYIQMKSITACVLERFEIDVLGKERRPEMMLSLTLRMKSGLPVQVRERERERGERTEGGGTI